MLADGALGLGAGPRPVDARDGWQVDLAQQRRRHADADRRGERQLRPVGRAAAALSRPHSPSTAAASIRRGGLDVGRVVGGDPVDGRRREQPGPGHAHDERGDRPVPGPQHELDGLVADLLDRAGRDQLHPVVGAPGEPADQGAGRYGGRRAWRSDASTTWTAVARGPSRPVPAEVPDQRLGRRPGRRTAPAGRAAGRGTPRCWRGSALRSTCGGRRMVSSWAALTRALSRDPPRRACRSAPAPPEVLPAASRSRLGRTPAASVTSVPLTRKTATAATAPTVVWVRRRAAPARRMIVARGNAGVGDRALERRERGADAERSAPRAAG